MLCALAICGILAALSVGAYRDFLARAAQSVCVGNLRQWGLALQYYMKDNDGQIPRRGQGVRPVEILDRPDDWFNCLPPYLGLESYQELSAAGREPKPGQKSLFVCPAAADLGQPHFLAYGMNMYLSPWNRPAMHRFQEIPRPAQLAFLADGPGGWSSTVPSNQAYSVLARHLGMANVVFLDGHVSRFRGDYLGCGMENSTLGDVRWETETDGINQTHVP